MDHIEILIVGAGVIGLAIARRLAQAGHEVLVIDSESRPGSVTSSRNSGVIHAGVYYAPDSLKARLCVQGRDRLYAYAAERGIPHKKCGKLIVATDESQIAALRDWKKAAEKNGLDNLRLLSPAEARALEPEVFCAAALHVPQTGIIDVPAYLLALEGDAENAGAMIALNAKAAGGDIADGKFIVDIQGDAPSQISCSTLINAAGLGAQAFAHNLRGFDTATVPPQVLAKGSYFSVTGKQPFSMLIYPLPTLGSSGLHAFGDMAGRVRFGPDVEWVEHIDYTVDPARAPSFETAVRRYWPGLPKDALQPDYCGIRPKIARASPHDSDFVIHDARTHKIPNLIQLYGIESPGLTSSLAIGDTVASLLEKQQ